MPKLVPISFPSDEASRLNYAFRRIGLPTSRRLSFISTVSFRSWWPFFQPDCSFQPFRAMANNGGLSRVPTGSG